MEEEIVNVAGGDTVTVAELARLVTEVVGHGGAVRFDATKPDGMPRKALDATHLRDTGWRPTTSLREGVSKAYSWFLSRA